MKVDVRIYGTHNPFKESYWVSRLRENLTSGSDGEGLETDHVAPRQSFTRQVFFKMMKHYLNLERETQLRDYDGMVAHITIAMSRYIFLSFEQRCHDDPRTLGSLFSACCDEVKDLSMVEALQRILRLAMEKIRAVGIVAEDVILDLVNTVMGVAVDMLQSGPRLFQNNNAIMAN